MRSTGSGPLGALLMLAPLIAVPILAVVGIPQFAPGNLVDPNGSNSRASARERHIPEEPRNGEDARPDDADDLFRPIDESGLDADRFADPLSDRGSQRRGRRHRDLDSDFENEAPPFDDDQSSFDHDDFESDFADTDTGSFDPDEESTKPLGKPSRLKQFADADPDDGSALDQESFGSRLDRSRNRTRPSGQPADDDLQSEEDANPFEQSPLPKKTDPRSSSPKKSSPRDPHDAPEFQPLTPDGNDGAGAEIELEERVPPESKRTPPGRRVVPPASPTESVEEMPEQSVEHEAAPKAAEQAPQLDELTWQTATKRLRSLGVGKSKQHFTYIEDRNLFLFTCMAIHRDDDMQTQRFQAEADEPLLAVRQVLEKLEAWQDSDLKPRSRPRTGQRAGL